MGISASFLLKLGNLEWGLLLSDALTKGHAFLFVQAAALSPASDVYSQCLHYGTSFIPQKVIPSF